MDEYYQMLNRDHEEIKEVTELPEESKEMESRKQDLAMNELEYMQEDDEESGSRAGVFKEHEDHLEDEGSNLFISAEKAQDSDEIQQIMKQFR